MIRIGIDASGGDSWQETTRGAILASRENPDLTVMVYGDTERIYTQADELERQTIRDSLAIVPCSGGSPRELMTALDDLKSGKIHALITGTNSQELLHAIIRARMKELDIKRPGLLAPFPTKKGRSFVIDVGATHRETKPEIFLGWALAGRRFLMRHCGVENPRIGLQNISTERAFEDLKKIHEYLSRRCPSYSGYVEPSAFVAGEIDLWLCDGFQGNSDLKLGEAYCEFVGEEFIEAVKDIPEAVARLKAKMSQRFSYEAHLVSPLVGVQSWLFRVHGNARAQQISRAFSLAATSFCLGQPI